MPNQIEFDNGPLNVWGLGARIVSNKRLRHQRPRQKDWSINYIERKISVSLSNYALRRDGYSSCNEVPEDKGAAAARSSLSPANTERQENIRVLGKLDICGD